MKNFDFKPKKSFQMDITTGKNPFKKITAFPLMRDKGVGGKPPRDKSTLVTTRGNRRGGGIFVKNRKHFAFTAVVFFSRFFG
mgnify:CR=1 FL=1